MNNNFIKVLKFNWLFLKLNRFNIGGPLALSVFAST